MREQKVLVAVDLDGTVFDDRPRKHLIDYNLDGDARWHAYHLASGNDDVFPYIQEHIQDVAKRGFADIAFWTARNNRYRPLTDRQIVKKVLKDDRVNFTLLMRPDDSTEKSPVLKARWLLDALENDKYKEVRLWDDREDVCEAYKREIAQCIAMGMDVIGFVHLCENGAVIDTTVVDEAYVEEHQKKMKEAIEGTMQVAAAIRNVPVDTLTGKKSQPQGAADILDSMAATFRERNAVYKDNYKVVGKVMSALFPNGVEITTEADHNFYHLFELLIVKLTRFTNSGLTHKDSIHDIAVYAAMLEPLVNDHKIKIK